MDLAFQVVALLVLLIALAALGALIFDIVRDGIGRLSWDFIAGYPSRRASRAGILPALTGSVSTYLGLLASYHFDYAAGASVVLCAVLIFFVVFTLAALADARSRATAAP